ncbi:hypothetical protein DES39_1051 [Orbus hercynius]|uniref:DUF2884 family protein n=1 Tax=Orbus hercynius TaxID=593135 RepID=A0A495RJW0_9GAMM|nr:hypothetical protein [Orbus hercynius]RKS87807.1 hypothetical protein DES39_1051 [Orbus hercynius]
MLKKLLFCGLIIWGCLSANTVLAKTKECLVKPSYDIVIEQGFVEIVNQQNDVLITPSGAVTRNNITLPLTPAVQQDAKQFQAFLRTNMADYELRSVAELNQVNAVFAQAIRDKLGNKSELLSNLRSLYNQLLALLHQAIITKDGVTYFYYQPFNNLKTDGEAISKKVFYKILGNSILHFDVFKNYSGIKKIAKEEWKTQKVSLQQFDESICALMTDIDNQYNHLMRSFK